MNGDHPVLEMAKRMADSTLDNAKRACDAMFDRTKKDSEALLDETKVKCDKMIDEAGDEALKIMKQKFFSMIVLFACAAVALLVTSFALGYFAGKG